MYNETTKENNINCTNFSFWELNNTIQEIMIQEIMIQELALKSAITYLPKEDQEKIERIANDIRDIVRIGGDNGIVALGLVGLEIQRLLEAEEERLAQQGN